MYIQCFLRKGVVYMPLLAAVGPGAGYRHLEPVAVIPAGDAASLRNAFLERFARGNPVVPERSRPDDYPEPVVLKAAGVKTWARFGRGVSIWMIGYEDGIYKIIGHCKNPQGVYVQDPDQVITMPPGTSADHLCDRMIEILQAAAKP
ncbi:MAG: hypothetical protein ACYDAR_22295 [Thermomicrobiales bacterium]